ncbi:unnamed protein product [Prorocentrum cordatum]|uniref:Uncharacterized protein n=1 Tax=Prorocentrum cordatum TaxID=2364126 RepID=A0ABN9PWI6_9DINO|nr:unnamed protein product [Polarella glacialis]
MSSLGASSSADGSQQSSAAAAAVAARVAERTIAEIEGDKYDDSGKYADFADRCGGTRSPLELLGMCEQLYCENADCRLSLVDETGLWTTDRHPLNAEGRGDEDSVSQREESVTKIGIIDIRKGPWYMKCPEHMKREVRPGTQYLLFHWGTLLEGARRAFAKDGQKKNRTVQLSVMNGVKACKEFNIRMPKDAIRFLINVGNLVNDQQTPKTFVEILESTDSIEMAWTKKKNANNWSAPALGGQAKLEEYKFEFIKTLSRDWRTYRNYELCNTFYKESKKVFTDGTTTVWAEFKRRALAEIAFTQPLASKHERTFIVLASVLRKLRYNHPQFIVDVIMQYFPRTPTAGNIGKGFLHSEGLAPIDVFKEDAIDTLMESMKESAVWKQLKADKAKRNEMLLQAAQEAQSVVQPEGEAAGSKKDAKELKKSQKKAEIIKNKAPKADLVIDEENDVEFLHHLRETIEYMMRVDSTRDCDIASFKDLAIRGCLIESVEVLKGKGKSKLNGFSAPRKIAKAALYKNANLAPRPSDPDFLDGEQPVTEEEQAALATTAIEDLAITRATADEKAEEYISQIAAIQCHFVENNSMLPIMGRMCAAKALSSAMGRVAEIVQKQTVFESLKEAALAITQAAIEEVRVVIPAEWDIVVDFIVKAKAQDKLDDIALTDWNKLLKLDNNLSNGSVYLDLLRVQLWMHMCSVLGLQWCTVRGGADQQKQAKFLPQLVHQSLLEATGDLQSSVAQPFDFKAPEKLNSITREFIEYLGLRGKSEAGISKPVHWETWVAAWVEESFSCHDVAISADGLGYKVKKARDLCVLQGATAAQMKHFIKNNIKKELKVSAQVDVFTNEKNKLLKEIMEAMDAEHAAELASEAVQSAPTQMILNRVALQTKPALKEPKSEKKKDKKAIQNGESDESDKQAAEKPLLRNWFTEVKERESAGNAWTSELMKKVISAAVSAKITEVLLTEGPCQPGCNLALDIKEEGTAKGTKKISVDIIRMNVPNATECKLPYWGKVVDGSVAQHMPRHSVMQLKLASGDGPDLWLDGAQFQNVKRSDFCPAWLITYAQPVDKDKDKDAVVQEPPKKKAKKSAQGVKYDPFDTHEVHYEPMPIAIHVNGEAHIFDYTRPYLKDVTGDGVHVYGIPCHRSAVDSDEMDIKKKAKAHEAASGFAAQ